MSVELLKIRKVFGGGEKTAVDDATLEVRTGEFFSLLGPSGCGKTTLLRIIAGLEVPDDGDVVIGGRRVNGVRARDRGVSMVFQNYALYPHMTGRKNMAFGLRNRHKYGRSEIARRVEEMAELLGITEILDRKPGQMSGGEQQRVALGRALVKKPEVFLLDEPLSNLDLKMREQMRVELKKLHRALEVTTIFVTHDQSEAMSLSDRIAVMRAGTIQQVGFPQEFYDSPSNAFVGRFIGSPSINLVTMHYDRDANVLSCGSGDGAFNIVGADLPGATGSVYVIGIRPQDVAVELDPHAAVLGIAEIDFIEHLGDQNIVVCVVDPSVSQALHDDRFTVVVDPDFDLTPGARVRLRLRRERAYTIFSAESGEAIVASSERPR